MLKENKSLKAQHTNGKLPFCLNVNFRTVRLQTKWKTQLQTIINDFFLKDRTNRDLRY